MFNVPITGNGNDNGVGGGGGDAVIDGGMGIDPVEYGNSPSGVTVNLATGSASDGWGGTDTLSAIENVIGSSFNDAITGEDRKSVVEGKSVDLGGRRVIKKKNNKFWGGAPGAKIEKSARRG